jgi:hypothetical protein
MRIKVLAISSCLAILAALCIFAGPAYAPTKIAPTKAETGHPFTIIDTPEKRLVDGSVAVFKLDGLETVLPLRTHKPYNTAQGRIDPNMYGGDYSVFVRQPNGTEIEIGLFTVLGPTAPPPFIVPDIGEPGDPFTITDALGRMQIGDLAVFYAEGSDPATQGVPADYVIISADGTELTGNVPASAVAGQNFVSVRPSLSDPSHFGDLGFFVTAVPEACIEPTFGTVGTDFTLTDPQGRMEPGDDLRFVPPGGSFEHGTTAENLVISADGTTATGRVPVGASSGTNEVHIREPGATAPLFEPLVFIVL